MHLTHNNIDALAEVADTLLGKHHPISDLIRSLRADPDLSQEAWRAIESLPEEQRKTFAALVAQRLHIYASDTIH
ncbi:MAG: hypothetical protein ACFBZ9_08270 [Sphingomonadales bacterium]